MTSLRSKRYRGSAGLTLIEVMVAVGFVGLVSLLIANLSRMGMKAQTQSTLTLTASQIKNNLVTLVNNSTAWYNTVNASGNTSLACVASVTPNPSSTSSISPANPVSCVVGSGTTANPAYQIMTLLDPAGNVAYQYNASFGYTQAGAPCKEYSPSGNDGCPLQFIVKWQPFCVSGTSCVNPQVYIQITANYSPATKSNLVFSPQNYSTSFYRGVSSSGGGSLGCWNWNSSTSQIYETCASNVGIGTTNPSATLDVHATNTPSAVVSVTQDEGAAWSLIYAIAYGANGGNALNFYRSRGTSAAPLPLQQGDNIGQINMAVYDGSAFNSGPVFSVSADGPFSPGNEPTAIDFYTKPATLNASSVSRLHIDSAGNVGIGTISPQAQFHVDSTNTPASPTATARVSAPVLGYNQNAALQLYDNYNGKNAGFTFLDSGMVIAPDLPGNFQLNYDSSNNKGVMALLVGSPNGFLAVTRSINPPGTMPMTPAYPLDVNGDINATGSLLLNGVAVCNSTGCLPAATSSDVRLKKEIETLKGSFEKILSLQGVSFFWKDPKSYSPDRQIGFIAQEAEKTFPEVVETDPHTGLKSMHYERLVAPFAEALKTLYARFEAGSAARDKELAELKAKNAALKARLEKLENQVN